jgi:anti-anti-sigma regulatory factor
MPGRLFKSAGGGILASARGNGAFALIAPQETVREILDMSGFSRIIPIVDDAANLA